MTMPPRAYNKTTSFNDYATNYPDGALPGSQLDVEMVNIEHALDDTQAALALIQRSDGALKNGVVTSDSLAPSLAASLIADVEAATGATADAALAAANAAAADATTALAHVSATNNPHNVTAAQVGNGTAQWNASHIQGVEVASGGTPVQGSFFAYDAVQTKMTLTSSTTLLGSLQTQVDTATAAALSSAASAADAAADAGTATTEAGIATTQAGIATTKAGEAAASAASVLGVAALKANNLSDLASAASARTNLGLGTAATTAASDYATAAQGAKADTALQASAIGVTVQGYDATILKSAAIGVTVQGYDATTLKASAIGVTVQGYDATILKSAAIGSTVQGYDANTVKKNVANTFTAQQTPLKAALTDQATVAWDCSAAQVATLTTTASRTIGAPTNGVNGTSYRLVLTTGGYTPSWNAAFKFPGGTVPSSLTGTCVFDFHYDGTNFLCVGQNVAEA
ncbi:protein of unknown function [Magnetospirillum sp. XM-1]|uniref:hypothetical protein n=1 Tax=Magnetospirillum sp. XM-1 TaxID=1663591 RepID=UPI00073DFA65|nr:hypothetical protein [Magnetospirillum sp. XM-1]CUW38797.1 protein of unknown function [Magnetospirillum sp. XM-1]